MEKLIELNFKGNVAHIQTIANRTYREFLEKNNVTISIIEEEKRIAFGWDGGVSCDIYQYFNSSLKTAYEYIQTTNEGDFYGYVVVVESDELLNAFELYDAVEKVFKEHEKQSYETWERMEKLRAELNSKIRLTRHSANLGECKYFLEWNDSQTIIKGFKTQKEVVAYLEDVKKNGGWVSTDCGDIKILVTEK